MDNDTELQFVIYRHQSPSGKNYIGITSQTPEGRWKNGNGYNSQVFHNAINKYGWDNFEHFVWAKDHWVKYPTEETIYVCSQDEACELERKFIDEFDSMRNGYNCSPGGEKLGHNVKMYDYEDGNWQIPPIRSQTCNHCIHQYDCSGAGGNGIYKTSRCGITGRKGSVNRGLYCLQFKNRRRQSDTDKINGYMVRTRQIEDYRTKNQWFESGYEVKPDAVGTEMYASFMGAEHKGKTFIYYLPDEVQKINRNTD